MMSPDSESDILIIRDVFNTTKCYDLMQNSSKGTVFETTIPFQLAFFALVEHDTEIAPLWDPENRCFVGLMTLTDYIQALRLWRTHSIPTAELTNRSIHDFMTGTPLRFQHKGFHGIDAEDSVYQLCMLLLRSGNDYAPVIDSDNGALVSILSFFDIVGLLDQAAKQRPQLFSISLQEVGLGKFGAEVMAIPKQARLSEVLDVFEQRNISSAPVTDFEGGPVIGMYHRSNVSFILRSTDPDQSITNLNNYSIEDCLKLHEQLVASGEIITPIRGLVTCRPTDNLSAALNGMMMARTTKVVMVDDAGRCLGILSIKDIFRYYLDEASLRRS